MRLHILSDIHLEFPGAVGEPEPYGFDLADVGADVIVLAGDIGRGASAVQWAARQAERLGIPVVFVAGNHEFYRGALTDLHEMNAISGPAGVHLLECGETVISGVRFLGATLWTDFGLLRSERRTAALLEAAARMNDFRLIATTKRPWLRFSPAQSAMIHGRTRRWLEQKLAEPFPGPTVVATHHAPAWPSVEPCYRGELLNAAFASNLEQLIKRGRAALWVHGHTHYNVDYRVGVTRVVTNQYGYPGQPARGRLFDSVFTVDI